jgi:hypothetical protein
MELMYLKVATSRMAGYTGVLGPVRFKDGVSEEMLPRHIRDRMAASMEFLEIDEDGNEQHAGAQHRLIREYKERAPKVASLARQTDTEKAAEIASNVVISAKDPVLVTRDGLEKIAEEKGIKGLREVGNKWGVKHRAIPTLIEMILDAQEKSVAARDKKRTEKAQAEADKLSRKSPAATIQLEGDVDPEDEPKIVRAVVKQVEPEDVAVSEKTSTAAAALNAKLKAAAATGNLAAAITQE